MIGPQKVILMSYRKNKIIVELFGLPGSGKTSLYERIKGKCVGLKVGKCRPTKKYFCFWIKIILRESIKVKSFGLLKFKISLLFNLYNRDVIKYEDFIIYDEGWLQRVLTFYESEISDSEIKEIFNHIQIPDKVIILKRDPKECFKRYNHPENMRNKMGQEYLLEWKRVMIINKDIIKKYLERQKIDFIEIDSEFDVNQII